MKHILTQEVLVKAYDDYKTAYEFILNLNGKHEIIAHLSTKNMERGLCNYFAIQHDIDTYNAFTLISYRTPIMAFLEESNVIYVRMAIRNRMDFLEVFINK